MTGEHQWRAAVLVASIDVGVLVAQSVTGLRIFQQHALVQGSIAFLKLNGEAAIKHVVRGLHELS